MKNYRNFLTAFCIAIVSSLPLPGEAPPNFVFILADDLGYGDLGCYGHPAAKTPRIDQLAKEGIRFTQHYANGPECSPTRTALLTGRYQQRARGLECAIGTGNVGRYREAIELAAKRKLGLPASKSILPTMLKKAGVSCGIFGKWHLGYEPEFNPIEHGWDEFFGYLGGNVHYFNHRELSELHVLFKDRIPIHSEGYMTHLITKSSIDFLSRNKNNPFFLFVSHETPHFPFQSPRDANKIVNEDNWTKPDEKSYVEMLQDMDSEVGKLLDYLTSHSLENNTVVIFVSDNGGFPNVANMGPLKGAKGGTFEGGIRVPLIVRWPGKLKAGLTSSQVCATFDLTYSILNLTGAKPEAHRLDGFDLINHLVKEKPDIKRTLYWRGKRGKRTWWAVRDGDLKYVRKTEDSKEEWLYDLSKDSGESNDLSHSQPKQVARMKKLLDLWEENVEPANK